MCPRDAGSPDAILSDAFDVAPVPLQCLAPDGTILRANQAQLDLLGYDYPEYVGLCLRAFLADGSGVEELLARLRTGETVHNHSARMRCRDGTVRQVLIDCSPCRDGGLLTQVICASRDVSAEFEDQLHRERERFYLAAEAAQDLIWDWDIVRGEVTWAGVTEEFFGTTSKELRPDSERGYRLWAARVHPEDLPVTEAAARTALEGGAGFWEHEYRLRRTDGSYARMLERALIVRNPAGRPQRVVGVMRDVTQRRVAEEATLRLAAIVASASDGIVGKTLDGVISSWNAAAERLFGYTAQEMIGQSVFVLVPPELRDTEAALLARVRQGERVEFSTTERIRKDGSRISVSLTVSPIRDPSGAVVGVSSIQRDVTERKRADEELVRREERYRALVMATTSIVWTSDPGGQFVEPQPAWEAYTGQSWEEYRGFGWMEALHPDDRDAFRTAWFDARDRRPVYEAVVRVWHRGPGRYRHFAARAAAVRGADGAVREWIGTLTDIEDQRTAEQRLRQAERLESVGRLAGGVAHEANNQMTVVLGSAAFLLRQRPDERAREDIEHIRRAAQRTAAITQQLLAFSRRQILQPQVVDLNATIRNLESVLQRALGESSRVMLRLAADLAAVKADPGQLDQVLLNLTFNARDAMPHGGDLTVETANVTLSRQYVAAKGLQSMAPGPYAMLMVSDTGEGMSQETLSHIFEPFFTTKGVGQGTGLGLSTVYGIVKQSGGFVWVYSEPGHGTAFKIYLPALTSAAPDHPPVPPPTVQGGPEVILVAEDDELVRDVLARSLREYGYTVLEAQDGADALEIALKGSRPPGLVIADVVMPRLNGRELSTALRRRWPELSVLFISGYTDLDSVTRGLVEEGCDFLQKPIETEVLARKVRAMLEATKGGGR
jgi:two-component system cell cycle sensor histidine kinase/response regulator CckA